jgi:hypothetical protein
MQALFAPPWNIARVVCYAAVDICRTNVAPARTANPAATPAIAVAVWLVSI